MELIFNRWLPLSEVRVVYVYLSHLKFSTSLFKKHYLRGIVSNFFGIVLQNDFISRYV